MTGLVALVMIITVQSIRVLIPILYGVRERSGVGAAVWVAVVVFAGPLVAFALRPVLGVPLSTYPLAVAAAALRAAMQFRHPIPLWLPALDTVLGLLALTFLLGVMRGAGRKGAGSFALAMTVGVTLDAALQAAGDTWDLAWQTGRLPWSVEIVLVLATITTCVLLARRGAPSVKTGAVLEVIPAALLGPFLVLQLLFFSNTAFASSTVGRSAPWAAAIVLLGGVLGVATVAFVLSRPVSGWFRCLGAVLLPVFVFAALHVRGVPVVPLVLIGAVLTDGLIAMALVRGDHGRARPGRVWWMPLAMMLAGLSFMACAFIYQISIDQPLPFPRILIPEAAAGLLALAAIGREPGSAEMRVARVRLLGPLAAVALLVPVGLAISSPSAAAAPAPGRAIRIVDYNIHSAVNADGQVDPEAIAAAIASQHPDVVVLQEVEKGWLIGGGTDEASWLSARLRMPFAWSAAADGQFGNVVLSRVPILGIATGSLPYGAGPQQRSYVEVRLDAGGGHTLTVIGTHLQTASDGHTRNDQIEALLHAWAGAPFTVIAGDMNAQPSDQDIQLFIRAGFRSAQDVTGYGSASTARDPNFPGDRPDWIFATPDLRFASFAIVHSQASDHLPIAVSVSPRPKVSAP